MHFHSLYCPPDPTIESGIGPLIHTVRPYTMVPDSGIGLIVRAVQHIMTRGVLGDFVECGVWQGGCGAALKLAEQLMQNSSLVHPEAGQPRSLHLFDSYEGLPVVNQVDGPMASQWQNATDDPGYYDNCTASLESVQDNFKSLDLLNSTAQFYKGWFEETIPQFVITRKPDFKISVLRLDGDWYSSTKTCLENLYPLVSDNGVIIIDDYYTWDGCALAVHEYLGAHQLNHRIRSLADFSAAYIVKKPHRDVFDYPSSEESATALQMHVQNLQTQVQLLESSLQRSQEILKSKEAEIAAMQSSKFWQMRHQFLRLKAKLGISETRRNAHH
jgi:O-methyltransferase